MSSGHDPECESQSSEIHSLRNALSILLIGLRKLETDLVGGNPKAQQWIEHVAERAQAHIDRADGAAMQRSYRVSIPPE